MVSSLWWLMICLMFSCVLVSIVLCFSFELVLVVVGSVSSGGRLSSG